MRRRAESGSAVVEFTLVCLVLIPLVLGIIQVGLCLHVRNTLASATSEGARTAARDGATLLDGTQAAQNRIADTLAGGYVADVTGRPTVVDGVPGVEVRASAVVPALGLFGPAVTIEVSGRAVSEVTP